MIILYSNNCPRCQILETKLSQKNIPFSINNNIEEMESLGFTFLPVLKIEDNLLDFTNAIKWINEQGGIK